MCISQHFGIFSFNIYYNFHLKKKKKKKTLNHQNNIGMFDNTNKKSLLLCGQDLCMTNGKIYSIYKHIYVHTIQ